jgi:hypothetical protein
MSKGHAVLRFMRKVHLYMGIFTTPALLFFAFTGAMQTFNLHEATPGSNYNPPAWIATLAQLHKKQDTTIPVRRPRPAAQDNPGKAGETGPSQGEPGSFGKSGAGRSGEPSSGPRTSGQGKSHLPMKVFFLLVSISLFLSALTGLYMSYRYNRGWWLVTGFLVAGVVVPLLLLPF